MQKKALITGITGQDGAYLAALLLEKNYKIYGAVRRSSSLNLARLAALGIADDIEFVNFDANELSNMMRVIEQAEPDEIYNLAAQSFVQASFDQPLYTAQISGIGAMRILEVIRSLHLPARFYQASTSEMFGHVKETPQNEQTPFYPKSPYGVAKLFAHWSVVNFRESFGLFASSGILFNHESPLRGLEFVTRKITSQLAQISCGVDKPIQLGNLDAQRDWGYAGDFVKAMWLMLQQDEAEDFVIATGQTYNVRQFAELAASFMDMELVWEGEGLAEKGIDRKTGRVLIEVNELFFRPAEVDILQGDAARARAKLGWMPEVNFTRLVEMMAKADLQRAKEGANWF